MSDRRDRAFDLMLEGMENRDGEAITLAAATLQEEDPEALQDIRDMVARLTGKRMTELEKGGDGGS